MLVNTSGTANSNKFYEVEVVGDSVNARYGRVGAEGQRITYPGGQRKADSLIAAKKRKGYTEVAVIGSSSASDVASAEVLRRSSHEALVAPQAKGDARVGELIDLLVDQNRHSIATVSGGSITVKSNGQVATPLGVLAPSAVRQARTLLNQMRADYPPVRVDLLENYLRLVPQNVGMKAGWQDRFLSNMADFDAQATFLDQLEASVDFAQTDEDARADFRYRLAPVDDAKVIADMQREYERSANARHGSVARAKVSAVYTLSDATDAAARFDALSDSLGNVRTYWHGTRAFNVLSLLASGFKLPKTAGLVTTGAMFGNGVYFSKQSSKSANYARGGVWSSGRDQRWFMLRCDVAMGRSFAPHKASGFTRSERACDEILFGKGSKFDSIDVAAGTSGVINHEAITGKLDAIMPRYLVEFTG